MNAPNHTTDTTHPAVRDTVRAAIVRLRLLVVLARPAVIFLFALVTALGVAYGGRPNDLTTLARAIVPVVCFLLFAVAANDLSDAAIDRVNLPGDRRRPLVTDDGTPRDMVVVAIVAAALAIVSSALIGFGGLVVITAGLAFAAAYSLEPIRLSARGLVASVTLPFGYVAVPFAVGLLATGRPVVAADVGVVAGLYVAFIGRLVLKDFRDVRGDALFGKRTFLVRHGRRAACAVAAAGWTSGTAILVAVTGAGDVVVPVLIVYLAMTLGLIVALARSSSARRDEALIAGAAIVGRGTLLSVFAHQSLAAAEWSAGAAAVVMLAIALLTLGLAAEVVRVGPRSRLTLPPDLLAAQHRERLGDYSVTGDAQLAQHRERLGDYSVTGDAQLAQRRG